MIGELVESTDWWIPLLVMLIAFLAGFIHTAIGFGFGIVAISLLPLVVDVRQAHIVISTASVPVMVGVVWTYRNAIDRRPLLQAIVGGAVGMPLGLWAFEAASMDWLVRGTGVAILVMVAMSIRNRLIARKASTEDADEINASPCYLAGFVAGFLAGAVSIAGPPVAAFALKQPWTQSRFKAFVNQFLFLVSIVKVAGLGMLGRLDSGSLGQAALMVPLAIFGIWIGARVTDHLPTVWFQRLVMVALVGVALTFLF